MDQKAQFEKKLIAIEIELGFLRVPKEGVRFMASESGEIFLTFDDKPVIKSTWNKKHQRIFGLTSFYKEKNAKPGDKIIVEFVSSRSGKTAVRPRKNTAEGERVGYTHPVCPPGGEALEHSRSQKLDTTICLY